MTPQEAGASLRDDPSFPNMSQAEREEEAALLLGDDDPLAVALAIEEAMSAPRVVVTARAGRDEGCRLEKPCASPRLAGNGKCMDCGAMRKPVEIEPEPAQIAPPAAPQRVEPKKAARQPVTVVVRPATPTAAIMVESEDFLSRYKALTGESDRMISITLGISRATAQAWISGRLAERFSVAQVETLRADIAERVAMLNELAVEMEAALAVA